MTLNYWMMADRYPNLKEVVGREIPKSRGRGWRFDFPAVKSPLYLTKKIYHVVKCHMCFDIGLSAMWQRPQLSLRLGVITPPQRMGEWRMRKKRSQYHSFPWRKCDTPIVARGEWRMENGNYP